MWVAFALQKLLTFFSAKNIRILYIKSAKTVYEMTLNELVKLTTLWTTGPWTQSSVLHMTPNPFSHGTIQIKLGEDRCCWNEGWAKTGAWWILGMKSLFHMAMKKGKLMNTICHMGAIKPRINLRNWADWSGFHCYSVNYSLRGVKQGLLGKAKSGCLRQLLLKTGDCLILVNLHLFYFYENWPLNTADCLIQSTFKTDLIVTGHCRMNREGYAYIVHSAQADLSFSCL